MHWRWREDCVPGTPWDNMATDQALLDELLTDGDALPIVRTYVWDRPSISVGRLQDAETVRRQFSHLPAVRRPTGGRAVVHGEDITFSLIARERDLPIAEGQGVMVSYRLIAGGLVSAFHAVGVAAEIGRGERHAQRETAVDCFALAAHCDIVESETGRKLVGCAQRRQNGVILQQMSIPKYGVPVEPTVFIAAVKASLGTILEVREWFSIDSAVPV